MKQVILTWGRVITDYGRAVTKAEAAIKAAGNLMGTKNSSGLGVTLTSVETYL